ncbi:MAG TPA: 4'-phosphopantetheinyl transferase superfamily protein [Thermoanaerobaculia bacterium]
MTRIALPESWRGRALVIGDALFSDGWFTPDELAMSQSFRLQKRRTEWRHGRLAVKLLAIELGLCRSARDCVSDRQRLMVGGVDAKRFVSIAHSGGFAAAAIDAAPVGIDVERRRHVRETAAHLFLTDDEAAVMREHRIADPMLHFWSAKEAVWKQHGGAIETLKRVPLHFEAETASGLRFAEVETFATGEIVVALTRPTS